MQNLILNSNWQTVEEDGPKFFAGECSTFDHFSFHGHRTCSVTQAAGCAVKAWNAYLPAIPVRGRNAIRWGYMIRAVDADSIVLWADFYDSSDCLVESASRDITAHVTAAFTRGTARFSIPKGARSVKLSLRFAGNITACTYFAPIAYFC